jgi:hypothetical protein
MTDEETIKAFCTEFNFRSTHNEEHVWDIGGLELCSPNAEDGIAGEWAIFKVVCIPGKGRTLGDPGDPDDWDTVLMSSHPNLLGSLEALGYALIRDWIDTAQMAVVDEDYIPI